MKTLKICILRIEGTNCELETSFAFKRLGASTEIVHLKQLIGAVKERERRNLKDYDLLVIPGGFSSGDYIRAGAILAARIKGALGEEIEDFIENGNPALGICNGFQVLVEMGLLPGFAREKTEMQQVALTTNDSARFECRPTLIKHESRGKCVFTRGIERGSILKMPCAHAEGKFFIDEKKREAYIQLLEENDQIVFRYVDHEGKYASYPWNPNGSIYNIAGICSPEGNILGLMPHPERAFYAFTDSKWSRTARERRKGKEEEKEDAYGDGKRIFESVLGYLRDRSSLS
ncbi:MAG: phosphoribosylformylglycinamidine synthase subunit PurQ [Methanophagales archaeon]|nr:phosphoribosylformylglycinamidine synthase subunit PurQ [Methanophagales archaeon]